jgi:Tol biopolymer transport system component
MFIADLLEEKVLDSDPDMPGGPPSWSPDSRYLVGPGRGAFTNTQGSSVQRADLLVYDMETDQSTWLIEDLSLEFN